MKELIVSNCERAFVLKSITEGTRLDGRNLDEQRPMKICFGSELGSCHVSLGNTKVTAHVSYKIEQPKQAKPNEGMLFINVELGPIGAPNFENRTSDLNVYLNRLIEKCIIDSRCVDLESLCIVSEEKVWVLRVDIHVLNHAGNIIECASVAALSCLAHFKRPDVTTDGEEIIIHSFSDKDPIPTVLHHYPVCTLFGFFNDEIMVADPNLLEETVCSAIGALFVVGMNSFREICLFDLTSAAITLGPNHIYKASQKAASRSQYLVSEIKNALAEDEKARLNNKTVGFPCAIPSDKLMTMACDNLSLKLKKFEIKMCTENVMKKIKQKKKKSKDSNDCDENDDEMTIATDADVAALLPTTTSDANIWSKMGSADEMSSDDELAQDEDIKITKILSAEDRIGKSIPISSDSEENEVVMLETESNKATPAKKKKKNKKPKDQK